MNAASPAVERYLAAWSDARARRAGAEPAWLREAREGAIARFAEIGFPTPRHEDWKYTRVDAIEKRSFAPAPAPTALDADTLARLAPDAAPRLVLVDGRLDPARSRLGSLPEGVRVLGLARALAEAADLVGAHLGRVVAADAHAFTALNAAFAEDGAVVHLRRGSALDAPLHLVFVASGAAPESAAHPRVLVIAEAGARARVVERYVDLGGATYLTNALTEIEVGDGAEVEHFALQEEGGDGYHVASLGARVGRDAALRSHAVSVGARLARTGIDVGLAAEGARCTLDGLFLAGGRQHVDFHTRIDHLAPHGTSLERYRGVLGGRARGVFNGRVYVHPGAQKTDARQTNDNLLLSRDAEVDTKPQLEIYADDVKCSHGATVGQLDETMLFYLRSRGIAEATARALLTWGFAREVIDGIDDPALREVAAAAVLARLPGAEHVAEVIR